MKNSKSISLVIISALITGAVTFSSCRKKEEKPDPTPAADTEQSTANDNNTAENCMADIEAMGSQVSEASSLVSYKTSGASETTEIGGILASPCASLTGIGTQSVVVDFGTVGCLGQDGRTRTGKLVFDFTASTPSTAVYYRNPGFSMKVTSLNYVVDGYQVNIINKTVTNTTPNSIPSTANPGTNLTWAITASVNIIKPSSAGTISWSCSRTKELMNTNDTNCYKGQFRFINWTKAIVKLNGTASGVNAQSENYTAVATNLIRDFNCSPDPQRPKRHPFIGGTILYSPGTRPQRLINYGNGSSCDLSATVTINNNVYNINL